MNKQEQIESLHEDMYDIHKRLALVEAYLQKSDPLWEASAIGWTVKKQ